MTPNGTSVRNTSSFPLPRVIASALLLSCVLGAAGPASAQAVEGFAYGDSSLGAARLGIAIATIAELADSPALLARPSSQSFVDATLAEIPLLTREPALGSRIAQLRALLLPKARARRSTIDASLGALESALPPALGAPRDRLFVVGALAEQIAYNARVLRDPRSDRDARAALLGLDVADPYVAGFGAARIALAHLPPQAWGPVATQAEALVGGVLGSPSATPFPPERGIWLVLLRSRTTPADRARGGAPHFSIDIVGFDGSHRSLAAYPDGGHDYARDAAHMPCLAGREPETNTSRVAPVDPPPGTTVAQLARTLEAGCAAAATGSLPYVVREASDDRFLTGLLVASGVDAVTLLGALR